MDEDVKERLIAIARLVVAVMVTWAAIANAAGIDVLDVMEILRYLFAHPEALVSAATIAIAWWYNENMTTEAQMAQKYMKLWKVQRDMAGGEEDMALDPDDPEDDDGPEEEDEPKDAEAVMEEE